MSEESNAERTTVDGSAASPCYAIGCDKNPVKQGTYCWGDRRSTTVRIMQDGAVLVTQGEQRIYVENLGFFRDVVKVYDAAIEAMPEGDLRDKLFYRSMGTSRSLPVCDWD